MAAAKGVYNALPKIPGYDFSALAQPATFAKSQGLTFVEGIPAVRPMDSQPVAGSVGPNVFQAAKFGEANILANFPEWRTLGGKVLRFNGYFTERVTESAVESLRVRRVTVMYYLEDNTLCVNENITGANTGLRGGCIMSRHKPDSLGVPDLAVGGLLPLRGRNVTLVDCDAFTRSFYSRMGIQLAENGKYPSDEFAAAMAARKGNYTKDLEHVALKQSMEMAAAMANGRAVGTLTREERIRTEQFLKHDREVLSFFATWDRRTFRVSYFVADGTMAVNFLKAPNDGRDPVAAFVKRGKIPKARPAIKCLDTIAAPRGAAEECFSDADLCTGRTINLFGREMFLYDCDSYTKEYYLNKFGISMNTYDKGPTEGDGKPISTRVVEYPPYNGFGTEEDSLGSVKHMVPKAPKKDIAKYIKHANDVLRFSAEFETPLPEDEGRKFILCYYLADDTVSLFEYAVRNSGHTGGKFFSRSKVPTITAESIYPGGIIELLGQRIKLSEADERTERFLETGESTVNAIDTTAQDLLARVRVCLTQKFLRVTDAYRHFSTSGKGIGFAELKCLFRECEVRYENDEALARVMQIADVDGDGVISLQEFVENVLKQSLAPSIAPAAADAAASASSSSFYLDDQKKRAKRQFADQVLKMFVAKLEARRAYIVDAFRIVSDRSVDGLIGADTFRQVVTERLGLHLSPEELDALVYRFYYVDNMPNYEQRRLTLRDFRKILEM